MKLIKSISTLFVTVAFAGGSLVGCATQSKCAMNGCSPATCSAMSCKAASGGQCTCGAKSAAVKPYTLKKCIVSGDELGEMGKPYEFVYQGQQIKLCCSKCKVQFDKDPAKYIKKMHELEQQASADN